MWNFLFDAQLDMEFPWLLIFLWNTRTPSGFHRDQQATSPFARTTLIKYMNYRISVPPPLLDYEIR